VSTGVDVNRPMPSPKPQQRSSDTKARILAAARRMFAREGYERATIRAIASAAEADPALVVRYFGSKEGLFAQAAAFDLRLPDIASIPREVLGAALVRHFLDRWEGDPDDHALRILLRAAVTSAHAAGRMREIFARQLLPVVAHVAEGQGERRAGLVASQVLGFALCRYILDLPAVTAMDHDTVVAWLGPTVQRYLTEACP
jgi:AcrR family transcriptional regulator